MGKSTRRPAAASTAAPTPTEAEIAEACRLAGISPAVALSWREQFSPEAFNREVLAVARVVRSPFGEMLRRLGVK